MTRWTESWKNERYFECLQQILRFNCISCYFWTMQMDGKKFLFWLRKIWHTISNSTFLFDNLVFKVFVIDIKSKIDYFLEAVNRFPAIDVHCQHDWLFSPDIGAYRYKKLSMIFNFRLIFIIYLLLRDKNTKALNTDVPNIRTLPAIQSTVDRYI